MKPKLYVPKQSESVAQQHLIQWFKTQYRKYENHIFAIPNGAWFAGLPQEKAIAYGAKRNREGLLKGVSDLMLAVASFKKLKHALFLEMKAEGETQSSVSKEQLRFLNDMALQGYDAQIAYGFDQAKAIIEEYMKGVT